MDTHKKGVMYVYKFGGGNLNPESSPNPAVTKKKSVWGLRKSKSYRETEHAYGGLKGIVNGGDQHMVEARKSVCVIEARKSVSHSHIEARKSVSHSHIDTNVASAAAFLQVKVLVSDMPGFMQVHAFQCARRTYDSLEKFSSKHLAYNMKKEFDKVYGPAWHCIVGSSFGSFVTHSTES
ncbi:uncharacterized protein LOC132278424 [Cornus florida]|uniref:uncharacterized protein LOC132278424 n=1 Tax=Cornus florida TaxID=4283 RepID=UPI00289E56A6|nr:uncharacterized protein LOC132278424 [Cornus florida]